VIDDIDNQSLFISEESIATSTRPGSEKMALNLPIALKFSVLIF